MRRTLIFFARGITQIRGKLAGTLSEIASAARKLHEAARGSVVRDVDVFAHALDLSAALQNTEDDVNHIWKSDHYFRERVESILDAFVWRKQPEDQQPRAPFNAELILVKIRIDEWNVRDAMRDHIDLVAGDAVDIAQKIRARLCHHDQTGREPGDLVNHATLIGVRLLENGVQRRDGRHSGHVQRREQVISSLSTKNPELVLHVQDIGIAEVQEIGCAAVGRQITFRDFKTHFMGIIVGLGQIADRN